MMFVNKNTHIASADRRRGVTRRQSLAVLAAGSAVALTACSSDSGSPEAAATYDPDEKVTLDFAFWGNDVRSGFYQEAFDLFQTENPNITVNSSVTDFPSFWEKRQIEAAGGSLPDVMQFDYSYLKQYSQNGFLLDLAPYLGDVITTDTFVESVLQTGVVDGKTIALTIGTNAWANFVNAPLLGQLGLTAPEGGVSYDDFDDWLATASAAGAGQYFGSQNYTNFIQGFQVWLRGQGKELFDADDAPGFTEEELTEFWTRGRTLAEAGAFVPQQRVQEVFPKGALGAGLSVSEFSYDNFGAAFAGDLGVDAATLTLVAPPAAEPGVKDLFLKPSMMHAIAASTEHPAAAALLVEFLLNDPRVGAIFGTSRGLPASSSNLSGVELTPADQAVQDYEASIVDRIGDPPPVPLVGFGQLEAKFKELGADVDLGSTSVADAVEQFFSEIDTIATS